MKNPLLIVSELFGASRLNIWEAATLDSCYDHIHEDSPTAEQQRVQISCPTDFETPVIQEIE